MARNGFRDEIDGEFDFLLEKDLDYLNDFCRKNVFRVRREIVMKLMHNLDLYANVDVSIAVFLEIIKYPDSMIYNCFDVTDIDVFFKFNVMCESWRILTRIIFFDEKYISRFIGIGGFEAISELLKDGQKIDVITDLLYKCTEYPRLSNCLSSIFLSLLPVVSDSKLMDILSRFFSNNSIIIYSDIGDYLPNWQQLSLGSMDFRVSFTFFLETFSQYRTEAYSLFQENSLYNFVIENLFIDDEKLIQYSSNILFAATDCLEFRLYINNRLIERLFSLAYSSSLKLSLHILFLICAFIDISPITALSFFLELHIFKLFKTFAQNMSRKLKRMSEEAMITILESFDGSESFHQIINEAILNGFVDVVNSYVNKLDTV